MLRLEGVEVRYGQVRALRGVDLAIADGGVVGIVGANGAGKSSLTLAIAGAEPVAAGSITFEGRRIDGLAPETIARQGISLVPEGRHVFADMTVFENLDLGASSRSDRGEIARDMTRLLERFPILAERRDGLAGKLSGGEQQQLVIARALMARPRLLILDEPSLGLAPTMIDRVYDLIAEIRRERGLTMLIVEQNPERLHGLADRVLLLHTGELAGEIDTRKEGWDSAYFGLEEMPA